MSTQEQALLLVQQKALEKQRKEIQKLTTVLSGAGVRMGGCTKPGCSAFFWTANSEWNELECKELFFCAKCGEDQCVCDQHVDGWKFWCDKCKEHHDPEHECLQVQKQRWDPFWFCGSCANKPSIMREWAE